MATARRWPSLASSWGSRPWQRLPQWPGPTPYSLGTARSRTSHVTVPSPRSLLDVLASTKSWKTLWSAWPERIARGGYDRIVGALSNLGYRISDQTVGNILKRHSILPASERKKTTTWREFIHIHMDVLGATNFFTNAVWQRCALVITALCYVISCSFRHLHAGG